MPTVHIFGMDLDRKQLLIGGGLIAAAVAVVVFLRARAASQAAAADQTAPQPDQSQGAGGGMSIPAPTQGVADQYQQQLDNAQLQAQTIANQYQTNLVGQQQKQFDLQQRMAELLAPSVAAEQQSALAVETHYNKAAADTRLACPGNAGVATDPSTGQLYCRQKTSGGILGIPVGDVFRTFQNFLGGVEAAAPNIGYNTAQQAAAYYTGKAFPSPGTSAAKGNPAARPAPQKPIPSTPGIAPSPVSVGHGYGDI